MYETQTDGGEEPEVEGFNINVVPGSLEIYDRALSEEEIEALLRQESDVELPQDGKWHDLTVNYRNGEVAGVEIDGNLYYATSEFVESRGRREED